MCLICHSVLLSVIFATFRVFDSIVSYGRSKYVVKLNKFEEVQTPMSRFFAAKQIHTPWELFATPYGVS
jgi:hypothetical protein